MFAKEYLPSEALSHLVERYLIFEEESSLKDLTLRITPNGTSEIAIHFGDPVNSFINDPGEVKTGYIYGPHTRHGSFTASGSVRGLCVLFKPWGAYRVFGISQMDIRDYAVELDILCGSDGRRVIDEVCTAQNHDERVAAVDRFLFGQYRKTKDTALRVCESISLIQDNNGVIRIRDLSKKVEVGIRTLERRFKETVGLTPKEYSSIVRINRLYGLATRMSPADIYDVIFKYGYYDQSHLINDVRKFTGLTANELFASAQDHVIYVNRMYTF